MSDSMRIESLTPQPLPDLRRVTLNLRVAGLPPYGPGAAFGFASLSDTAPADRAAKEQPAPNVDFLLEDSPPTEMPEAGGPALADRARHPSPYPDVALSILDQDGNEVAGTFIVEHKEPNLDFTLHLRAYEPGATYIAQAEMSLNDELVQIVQVPFELK